MTENWKQNRRDKRTPLKNNPRKKRKFYICIVNLKYLYFSGIVADLVKDHNITGLIGPACVYALDPTAKLAGYWNIPIVTG